MLLQGTCPPSPFSPPPFGTSAAHVGVNLLRKRTRWLQYPPAGNSYLQFANTSPSSDLNIHQTQTKAPPPLAMLYSHRHTYKRRHTQQAQQRETNKAIMGGGEIENWPIVCKQPPSHVACNISYVGPRHALFFRLLLCLHKPSPNMHLDLQLSHIRRSYCNIVYLTPTSKPLPSNLVLLGTTTQFVAPLSVFSHAKFVPPATRKYSPLPQCCYIFMRLVLT